MVSVKQGARYRSTRTDHFESTLFTFEGASNSASASLPYLP